DELFQIDRVGFMGRVAFSISSPRNQTILGWKGPPPCGPFVLPKIAQELASCTATQHRLMRHQPPRGDSPSVDSCTEVDRVPVREGDLAEINDPRPAHELTATVGDDLVAAEREVPVLRTGILDHAPDVEGEVAPLFEVSRVHSVEDRADERARRRSKVDSRGFADTTMSCVTLCIII